MGCGKRNPKNETLERIAKALDCNISELTGAHGFSDKVISKHGERLSFDEAFTLGQKIKFWRIEKGLEINELAELISVPADEIEAWESNKKSVNLEYVSALSKSLGIQEFYFLLFHDLRSLNPNIPNTAGLSGYTFPDNFFMPKYYRLYYDQETEIHYIEFPDGFVLQLTFDEFLTFAEEIRNYTNYCLEQRRNK